jgi:hypothetical protein
MAPSRPVDHKFIADLCARHGNGDYYTVAGRFCEAKKLSARDKLRIARLAEQQKMVDEAGVGAAKQGYVVAGAEKKR